MSTPAHRWLAVALPAETVREITPLTGGFVNETLWVRTDGGEYVLRRFLRANTVAVQVALLALVRDVVPVPEVVAVAEEPEPMLLTRYVPGRPQSELLGGLPAADACSLGAATGRVLAAIGTVRFDDGGFFTGPSLRPDGTRLDVGLPEFVAQCLDRSDALTASEANALRELAERSGPLLDEVRSANHLVHADFNPKNLLAARDGDDWVVTVLDWEFSFSGHQLVDVGNLLRFADELPGGYVDGFLDGFTRAGGELGENWRAVAGALDLYALAEMLPRADGNAMGRKMIGKLHSLLMHPPSE